ncbi:AMP-dependent synthetase/ligase [Allokutzneria sp. A3M-2-11 16]|uniref:AMP-dependent synthetase/ligase n=1 Tax=Allokutzneria sp. A3M-2-11 16 TaxID=2962043 RepID=UPI0020B855FD|nr:AMP-dependent synthetase/ligase [Allokutzneria sp. A3M-2-11 16]MCP3800949.1 AMP-dependent synthetase/ligase [Allokutzneria sp. A3M-2-11 16]
MVALRFKRDGRWRELSYEELHDEVAQVAGGLVAQGVRPGDRVAVLGQTSPEWTICDLAIDRIGAVCVPIYPTSSPQERDWVLSDSGARLLVEPPDLPRGEPVAPVPRGEDDPSTIIYTSGTTGPAKGCLLTPGNLRAARESLDSLITVGVGDVVYLYLPLAHLFARMTQAMTLARGATLAYFGGDIKEIVTELTEVRPTHLPSVPRLFEKVYARVTALTEGMDRARVHALVRGAFGGRLREALTGAAPISPEILEFFAACGVPVYEAYGMTESTAVISANAPGAVRFGSVGKPLPGVEVRIAEDGEVLAKGRNVFAGYHRDEAASGEALRDGWLHTGDLGALDDDGYLHITGRKKDLIITAGGKNISPSNLENDLRRSPWISHAVMFGDRMPYAVALITLDAEEILPWARENGLPEDIAELARHPRVLAVVDEVVAEANSGYSPPERIRRFTVLGHDFSQESGELTPTMKLRRKVVHDRYSDLFSELYGGNLRS